MNNPLTRQQQREFEKDLVLTFRETYKKILNSGALHESRGEKGSHVVAKYAVVLTAEQYLVCAEEHWAELENLKHFV